MWQPFKGLPIAAAMVIVLALAVQATGATPTTSSVYTVSSLTVPGVDTGLVLKKGQPVTVTATGIVCPGTGYCTTPEGVSSGVDTKSMVYGGFLQPAAPAYGLVARVGTGSWTQVGIGPKQLSGKGRLVFAFNDDLYIDNAGAFVVTVTSGGSAQQGSAGCQPGWGNGDTNHTHTGPPGQTEDACRPGNGYGDKNHEHDGPPGQSNDPGERGKPSR